MHIKFINRGQGNASLAKKYLFKEKDTNGKGNQKAYDASKLVLATAGSSFDPDGWNSTKNFTGFWLKHNGQMWVSKTASDEDNIGHEPIDGSDYWLKVTGGDKTRTFQVAGATEEYEAVPLGQMTELEKVGVVKGKNRILNFSNETHYIAQKGTDEETEVSLNMFDNGSAFEITPKYQGEDKTKIRWSRSSDSWSIGGKKVATVENIEWLKHDEETGKLSSVNISGDTDVSVEWSVMRGQIIDDYLHMYLSFKLTDFSVTLPTDSGMSWRYDILDGLSSISDITGLYDPGSWSAGSIEFGDLPYANIHCRAFDDGTMKFLIEDLGHVANGGDRTSSTRTSLIVRLNTKIKIKRG